MNRNIKYTVCYKVGYSGEIGFYDICYKVGYSGEIGFYDS